MYKEIIVVEGIHDQEKVNKAYPNATVLTTGGSAVSDEFIEKLKALSHKNTIILLLDPDYPGSKIRQQLNKHIKNATNAYIDKEKCQNKDGKVGVEYASEQTIIEALKLKRSRINKSDITKIFLYDLGYLGKKNSKEKRNSLLKELNLGQANGKTFLKLLIAYGITQKEVLSYEA